METMLTSDENEKHNMYTYVYSIYSISADDIW